ncbi:coiled-coil domain-containing protein 40 [Anableps anableps]
MQNEEGEDGHDEDLLNAEDGASGVTIPPSVQNPSPQQSDDLTLHPDPDLDSNMAALANPQLSIDTSEDDLELPQEEEEEDVELIILDPEHQTIKKEEAKKLQDISIELFRTQEKLARAENKLHDSQQAKANAEAQRQHAQDQLEQTKSKYSNIFSQSNQAKVKVSRLQGALEKKQQQVTFAEALSDELHLKVKVMDNARHKVGTEKTQAEEEKIKQDLYVERLTKELESQTRQLAEYELQRSVQAQETQEATQALCEAEMELESLLMMHKKLLHQWNSCITDIKRHDETINVMQAAVRSVENEVTLLDRETEVYMKCISAEKKNNEALRVELNRSEMDCVTWEKLISQKKMHQEAVQAQYSACQKSLSETKQIFATLTKEMFTHQNELNSQSHQIETLNAARLELEEKIMDHIQQQLTHSKSATYSQHLTNKLATQKKEKMNQLQQLEKDTLSVKLECQKVEQHINSLTLTMETLDEEINKYNSLLNSHESTFSSMVRQIKQKETSINTLKNRIYIIVESTGHEDLNPLQIRIQETSADIEELAAHIKNEQRLWTLHQGTLVGLTKELETNKKKMRKLQKDYTGLQQKEIRLNSQIEQEEREQAEMDKNSKLLRKDLEKLCKLKTKNKQRCETLELENTQMETDFKNKLKEAEQESASLHMKLEKTQDEKENLLKCQLEAKQQIMLWERKIQILKETRSVVNSEINQREIQKMKTEIHRMELQVTKLTKQQEQLMRESEKAVAKREHLDMRKDAMVRDRHKDITKEELKRSSESLQRKIHKTLKEAAGCEKVVNELENSKTILSEKIQQQKQHLTELSCTSTKQGNDLVNLQDDKNMNQTYLFAMQNRNKKLQEVCRGSYKLSSSSETVAAALQSQSERLEDYRNILKSSSEDFPQHQGALRRVILAVEAYLKVSKQ